MCLLPALNDIVLKICSKEKKLYPWREQMESEEMYMMEKCKEKDSMREFEHVFLV